MKRVWIAAALLIAAVAAIVFFRMQNPSLGITQGDIDSLMDNAEAFIGQVEDLSKDTTISADERKDKMIAFVNARGVTGENALLKIEAIAFAASYYVMIELPPARLAAQRETGPLPFLEENMKKLHPKDRMLLDENREQLKKFAEQH